ncbi:cell division ATP-binding protein FtsE [Corynebacterium uterequi]|uniref:cell division ATP-binding protein FtsE n=1 Tax=Corynebacterium uterequi TaxID=1072256 RepID=UPI001EECFA45|nr:ATP-binding cassette domain-containing protein [Corynebacterium uterequi]
MTKSFATSTRPALDHIDLSIDAGEFVFLIGPSGSGKSTLLNVLTREENIDSGAVHFADMRVDELRGAQVAQLRRRIGYVFQDFRLLPRLSVYDNVAFAQKVIGRPAADITAAVPEALAMVGLDAKANRMPSELSGGERQRVAIARAVVNKPLAILADEPTGNLDPDTAEEIMALFTRIHAGGTTVVMSTHNARAVDQLRQRVVELHYGKIVRDDARGVYSTRGR